MNQPHNQSGRGNWVRPLAGLTLASVLVIGFAAHSQIPPKPETVVEVRMEPARLEGVAGTGLGVTLVASIREGFHINSHQPLEDYLIATRVELVDTPQADLEKVHYPAGELKSFGFAPGEKLSVYEGVLRFPLQLRLKAGTEPGSHALQLRFHYQACNDQLCLRPAHKQVSLVVHVTPGKGSAR
jgi:hypothetical protein